MSKLLIPLSYLTEACNLSSNIQEKEYKMHLKEAQKCLKDILGPEFYEEIDTQYSASADTFSSDNSTLYEDYLKDYLAWRTYYEYMGFSQTSSTATGFKKQTSEFSETLSNIELISKEKNVYERVKRRENEIVNFLELSQSRDSSKYPLWTKQCKEEFSWGISSISRDSHRDNIFSVNQAIKNNE